MILTRTNLGSEGVNPKASRKHFQNCLLMLNKAKKRSCPWRNSFDCTLMDHISNDHLQRL